MVQRQEQLPHPIDLRPDKVLDAWSNVATDTLYVDVPRYIVLAELRTHGVAQRPTELCALHIDVTLDTRSPDHHQDDQQTQRTQSHLGSVGWPIQIDIYFR